jgi:hypothetical protein
MHAEWAKLIHAVDRALLSLGKSDAPGARIHLRSAEHTAEAIAKHAKGPERDSAAKVQELAHKAAHTIDPKKAHEVLKAAEPVIAPMRTSAAAPPQASPPPP